ncbi:MAG: TIGR00180 family glycosyltransferase [Candidatus Yanofskybacteria bacterium]|nr:TIGR00180 family glycosyltransferase [Candidatus Yanofskybacteria bacterium]
MSKGVNKSAMDFVSSKLYYLTNNFHESYMKVAIIIPTMNRPDFILRQFEFYEFMSSPHSIYILDSSNEENAEKLKEGIKKFKNFETTYQWAPPGKDCLYQLTPLIKEKYCVQIGDDDIVIPKTISECADFLEEHPDYGTCAGKQVDIRFRQEDYSKPYGLIEQQTLPLGRSVEDGNMLVRAKNFWSDPTFICFAVRRTETEKTIRNITKHFGLLEDMLEFLLLSILIISGKSKVLDKLGYVMQISGIRSFDHSLTANFSFISEKWSICEKGFSEIIQEKGVPEKESLKIIKWIFLIYLVYPYRFSTETGWLSVGQEESAPARRNLFKKLRYFISSKPLLKSIYYKFYPPSYVDRPESKYFNDFKIVKDFLESYL